jgi:hypothetical protein
VTKRASSAAQKRAADAYKSHHWGYASTHSKDVDLPGLPKDYPLTEMGLLTHLHVDAMPGVRLPKIRTNSMDSAAAMMGYEPDELSVIEVDTDDLNNNHLSWDPAHPSQRLYLHLSPSSRRDARKLWKKGDPTFSLHECAQMAGGRHAKRNDYPDVRVQPLGILYFTSYYTLKEDESGRPSPSIYIHRMGEEGGIEPVLAVSSDGNLWICGGSYTVPVDGITK